MQIQIGCTDGRTYTSDYHPDEEVMKELEASNFVFGTDDKGRNIYAHSIDEMLESMNQFFRHNMKNDYQTASLTMGGVERRFNTSHIVWWEFLKDKS